MSPNDSRNRFTRREWLHYSGILVGSAAFAGLPSSIFALPQQKPPADPVAAARAQMAAAPIQTQKLAENITLLSGPGGNVVVLNGSDGKLMVDTFVQPVWLQLKEHLDSIGNAPLKNVIDTHWHFDHTDNNAHVRAAGAIITAHDNTKLRMSQSHDLVPLGLHFGPSPADALPEKTFKTTEKMQINGESISMGYVPPAHTDTDIYVHFENANVLHAGDVFFNGMYPFIDGGTGGNVHGMIGGATKLIAMADSKTKIVPGHGPLGDKASLTKYRDMLAAIHDNVQKQKASGKSLKEVQAAKLTSAFDAVYGKGMFTPDAFVSLIYDIL